MLLRTIKSVGKEGTTSHGYLVLGHSNRQSNAPKRLKVSPEALEAQRAAVRERVREAERRKKKEAEVRRNRRRAAKKTARRKWREAGKAAAGRMPSVPPPNRPFCPDEPPRSNPMFQTFRPIEAEKGAGRPFGGTPDDRPPKSMAPVAPPGQTGRSGRAGRTLNRRGRLALVLVLIAACAILVWVTPWFRVHRIRVKGQAYMDAGAVETASGLSVGTHALKMISGSAGHWIQGRSAAAEHAVLQALPNIQSVTARFVIPSEALLSVELKPASAYIQSGSSYWLIDDAGYAVAELMPGDVLPAGTRYLLPPATEGQTLEWPAELAPGGRLGSTAVETLNRCRRLEALLRDLDAAVPDGLSLQDDILSVQLSGQKLIIALNLAGEPDVSDASAEVLKAVRIQVNPDRGDCREQLRWLRYALRSGQLNDLGEGILDLSGSQRVFRPQALLDQLAALQPADRNLNELQLSDGAGDPESGRPSETEAADETTVVRPPESEGTDEAAVPAVLPMNGDTS